MHAVALQHCPRCQIRDKVSAPLTFKAFTLPEEFQARRGEEPDESTSSPAPPAAGGRA